MTTMDVIGPAIGAGLLVLAMSLVPEPRRRILNAVIVGGASGVYLSGGFGVWELVCPVLITPLVYRALDSHRYIGVAWLLHAVWDLAHHFWGHHSASRAATRDGLASPCVAQPTVVSAQ
jgi:hypothetical protein